jgi:hypothetical protein
MIGNSSSFFLQPAHHHQERDFVSLSDSIAAGEAGS